MSSSSDRLFNRQRTIHEILGGGIAADAILWRRKNLTVGILTVTLAAWVVFERSGYTLLSLVSSVLFLLSSILFLWAKSALILNRPAPPLPRLYLTEETANEASIFIRDRMNTLLSVCEDIATGKDPHMFIKVAASLLLISIIGGFTDFPTLAYTSLVIVLTIPVLFEMYEDNIDKYVMLGSRKLLQFRTRLEVEYISKIRNWILEQKKLN